MISEEENIVLKMMIQITYFFKPRQEYGRIKNCLFFHYLRKNVKVLSLSWPVNILLMIFVP